MDDVTVGSTRLHARVFELGVGMVYRSGQDDADAPPWDKAATIKQMTRSTVTGVIAYRSTLL